MTGSIPFARESWVAVNFAFSALVFRRGDLRSDLSPASA